jgi:hypothetical protein
MWVSAEDEVSLPATITRRVSPHSHLDQGSEIRMVENLGVRYLGSLTTGSGFCLSASINHVMISDFSGSYCVNISRSNASRRYMIKPSSSPRFDDRRS